MASVGFIFIFCLESTLGKYTWVRVTSTTVMIIFRKCHESYLITTMSKVVSQKLRGTLTKAPLQLKILQTWIKICLNSFSKTWVNTISPKSRKVKVSLKLLFAKNTSPHFKEHCTKVDDTSLIVMLYASSSLKQTYFLNLTQALLTYWIAFVTVYLNSYFLIIDILWSLNFIQCLYVFFIKTTK